MGVLRILLVVILILVILGSFISIYNDVISAGNVKTTKELKNSGYAVVGVYVDNPNAQGNEGGKK